MKVTIVEGAVSDLRRREMAAQFKARYAARGDGKYVDADTDQIFFKEVEVCAAPDLCWRTSTTSVEGATS